MNHINSFNIFNENKKETPKCSICNSRMYVTDRGAKKLTYHCSSEDAKWWNFERGSSDQKDSRKHWDDSRLVVEK